MPTLRTAAITHRIERSVPKEIKKRVIDL